MKRYDSNFSRYEFSETIEGDWVKHEDALAAIAEAVAKERAACAAEADWHQRLAQNFGAREKMRTAASIAESIRARKDNQ